LVHIIEEIIQDVYAFYNNSAKRRRRLMALAQNTGKTTMEDKAIETLENTVEKTLKKGTSSCELFT
jgi:Fic family protein